MRYTCRFCGETFEGDNMEPDTPDTDCEGADNGVHSWVGP